MTKRVMLLLVASPILFAQGSGNPTAGSRHWVLVAAAFAMAIASGLCGLAQGKAVVGAESMARNRERPPGSV